jgi:hypothetical protein
MILPGQPLGLYGEFAWANKFVFKLRGFTCISVDSLEYLQFFEAFAFARANIFLILMGRSVHSCPKVLRKSAGCSEF